MQLGAFGDAPPAELAAVHDEWYSFIADLEQTELIGWTIDSDREGADLLGQLVAAGLTPSPAIERAVGPLTADDLDRIAGGEPMAGDPLFYVRARGHLQEAIDGLVPPSGTATVADTTPAPVTAAPQSEPRRSPSRCCSLGSPAPSSRSASSACSRACDARASDPTRSTPPVTRRISSTSSPRPPVG